jgi:hypothetical protein
MHPPNLLRFKARAELLPHKVKYSVCSNLVPPRVLVVGGKLIRGWQPCLTIPTCNANQHHDENFGK